MAVGGYGQPALESQWPTDSYRRYAVMSDTAPIPPALGICLEEYEYPYPVRFLPLSSDLQPVSMAYMDIPPGREPNGKTVVLIHGKAFGCYYFRNVIEALTGAGYRVVAPDQIGWGKSPKPDIHYSFQLLAANTAALPDHLGVTDVAVLGYSTGGMTAARFALTYPGRVTHLVLEDPLGLADYRTGIRRSPRKPCTTTNCTGPTRRLSAATSRATSCIPTRRYGSRWPTSWSG
jgi:pimeloyl-ACP methyl ester carboxylesterase